jgi:hypothetical protein
MMSLPDKISALVGYGLSRVLSEQFLYMPDGLPQLLSSGFFLRYRKGRTVFLE